jgi:hypothetical protein
MVKCPCLYSAVVPLCRADMDALRIPPPDHLSRFCLGGYYRRCELFRAFLEALAARPEQWPSQGHLPDFSGPRRRMGRV